MGNEAQRTRCKAKKRDGTRCGSWAVKGFEVCRMHGAGGAKKGRPQVTVNLKHGAQAWRIKRMLSQEGIDRIEELAQSPEILNMARTVAASQFLIEENVPMQLTDDEVAAWVKLEMGLTREPTEAEVMAGRLQIMDRAQRALMGHSKMQADAKRALTQEQLLAVLVVPILSQLGSQFMKVVERHVDPDTLLAIRRGIEDERRAAMIRVHQQVENAG